MANIIDNFIGYINPAAGLKRIQNRTAMNLVKRGYESARRDRRTKGWNAREDYNSGKTISEVRTSRARSRDLFKNNPYAFKAHTSISNNTIGTGILPAIQDKTTKKVWKEWAEDTAVDFDGHFDFYGLQHLCMKTMSVHGEVLILRIKTKFQAGRVPLELKAIAPVYLDTSRDVDNDGKGGYIIGGVQFGSSGKITGYWIFDRNPSDHYSESKLWKAEDVIHLFQIDEPGQIRGVPFGNPSIMSLRDYDDYADAQLMRQKIAACFSVFVSDSEGFADPAAGPTSTDDRLEHVEPGMIEYLEPGKQVTFAAPPPAEGYSDYSKNVLTGISSGFGTTYEAMTGDLSNVNFSSGRMGWLEYQRMIETWQWFIVIPKLCKRVWKWFIEAAVVAGELTPNATKNVEWTAPRRAMIDPVKETKGLVAQVRAGFMSWQEAVRSLGYTPEEILEEMKASAKLFDDAGLKPESDPRFDSNGRTEDNLPENDPDSN